MSTHFSCAQAAQQLGISRNTLLRWFREGRIEAVARDRNGWRVFSDADIARLKRELEGPTRQRPLGESGQRMRAYLRRVPAFAQLPEEVLDQLAAMGRFQGFLRGQRVYMPGERARGLYILVKGRVRVFRANLEGKEQTLHVAVPFQTLGESVLFRHPLRHANHALCLDSSTVLILPAPQLLQVTLQSPQLALAFLREFSRRIEGLEERLEEQALLSLEQRLARLLLDEAGPDSSQVTLRMSLAEMASYLGVARESLSRVLVRFAHDGIVERSGRSIRLLDPEALEKM